MPNITFTEGSGVNDSIFGKSQAPIRLFIEKKGEAFEQKSVIKELFNMESTKNYADKFTTMTAMDGFLPVGENGAVPMDGMQEGYSKIIEQMTWKDGFSISREMMEDAKLMDLKKQPSAFTAGYYRTREKFGAALFGGAIRGEGAITFNGKTFDTKAADGLCLFSKVHKSKLNRGTQSNQFADAFSAAALGAVETQMQDMRGDNGEVLDIAPNTIVIPNEYTLKNAVFEAIGADKDPDTANNGFNYQYGRWTVIIWPYLNQYITGGTKPWLLLDTNYNKEYGGAIWLDRTGLDVNSYVENGNHANVWTGFARFTAGFNDWRFAAVGGVSGGTQLISAAGN